MTFKHFFYNSKDNKEQIFESIFEHYYEKGYFGKISKPVIKESQKIWFNRLNLLLEEGDKDYIMSVLENRDNICTREYFGKIYGENILESSRNDIKIILEKIFK